MRVVLLSRYPKSSGKPRGGVESVTVVLAHALAAEEDMDVHIITLESSCSEELTETDDKLTIHRLPASRWPQALDVLCGPGKKLVVNKIKQLEPDIVHSHETFGLTLGDIGVPHVFTVHGFDHANILAEGAKNGVLRSALWKKIEKYGLSRHKHIISISPYVKGMITPLTNATIYDIDNPVGSEFFEISNQSEEKRILCVGWIDERKNTLGSITSFSSALDNGVKGKLVIAGEAKGESYKERVLATIKSECISGDVELLGHITHKRLVYELSKASVLLLPSLQENAPMVISEAMAAGVPVIASDRCGMPYMIEEGISGFLIDPENQKQIVGRITKLLASSELVEQMGGSGREIAHRRFHPKKVAAKTIGVYKAII